MVDHFKIVHVSHIAQPRFLLDGRDEFVLFGQVSRQLVLVLVFGLRQSGHQHVLAAGTERVQVLVVVVVVVANVLSEVLVYDLVLRRVAGQDFFDFATETQFGIVAGATDCVGGVALLDSPVLGQ